MHEWIVHTALYIGYAVMIVGGVLIAVCLISLAASAVWKLWINGMNTGDVMEACAEWRKRHPEKYALWKRRNVK